MSNVPTNPGSHGRNGRTAIIILLCILCVIVVAVAAVLIVRNLNSDSDNQPVTESQTETIPQTEPVTEPETEPETEPLETAVSDIDGSIITVVRPSDDTWYLTLVNRHYVLPEDFTCETSSLKGGYELDTRAAEWFNKMYDAAREDGITLNVLSGYRRIAYQAELYEKRVKRCMNEDGLDYDAAKQEAARWVLPPGTSDHNLGLAADIGWLTEDFEDSDAYKWLDEHAADYGFILRYPADKEDITEIHY